MKARKSFKKLSVFMVIMALVLCMLPMSALAQTSSPTFDPSITSGSLTVNKTDGAGTAITDPTLQYSIYKIATVSQTNVGGSVSVQYTYDSGVVLTGGGTATGTVPSGVTAAAYDTSAMTAYAVQTNTGGSGTLVFSGLPLGLYLVKETGTPAGVSQSNDFLVSIPQSTTVSGTQVWDYDPVATPKNTVVDGKVSKTVTGGTAVSGATNTWTASLGSTVTYAITATLPSSFTATPYTTYTITDTPATGLVIDKDGSGAAGSFAGITVSVAGTTLTQGTDYTITNDAGGTGFVVELITNAPTGVTPGTQAAALTNGAVVTITYNATLSPTATGSSFTNAVAVNSQYNTPGGTVTPPTITPDPTDPIPTIVTYDYALQKVDSASAPLAGATFAIQNASGDYLTWSSTTGWGTTTSLSSAYTVTSATGATNAIVSFNGLAGGSYSLVEVSAPTGYSQLTAAIPVTVDATSTADADIAGGGVGYSTQVVNSLANTFVLPGTGGMGIYLYTIGGVLLIGAAILLFARNRKRNANNA